MKNVKKKIGIAVLAGGLVVGGLFVGDKYGASNSWGIDIINQAGVDLNSTAKDKTGELLKSNSISDQMRSILSPEIEAQQAELERLLEEYYQLKIQGLTGTAEFKDIQLKIQQTRTTMLNRYKKEIDAAFTGQ